ncbi:coiled-coil domain-containing protein 124 [Sapajus apella]|uniref:Coiled-coil domain-containing protein 124 n=1 Tax=Sapajus apella TaxID=9515 RepID=A0A6J3H1U2_SAPAP|nr:coiled-coil domain-containing protein 124 [Sapajus apella]XP_032123747.1 coiled-coil domain-containing protein 124 [Sapajus apella]
MPKKFQGENTKSAAARARRAEAKAAADARKQKELEDAYWKDDDKHVMRKEQRKVRAHRAPVAPMSMWVNSKRRPQLPWPTCAWVSLWPLCQYG